MKVKAIDFSDFSTLSLDEPVSILAESGGTKTDWRIKHKNEIISFETCNFHPKQINKQQDDIIKILSSKIKDNSNLFFFGSGCLKNENQNIIKSLFKNISFNKIEVFSDLEAAGKAIYGKSNGFIGILGTGSVFYNYCNTKISNISGGCGYILGDEGSGYYFGKLAIKKYLQQKVSPELKEFIENKYGDYDTIISKVYSQNGKQFIGQFQLNSDNHYLMNEINQIHLENISLFLDLYLPKDQKINQIGFVGSYAYYNYDLINQLLKKKQIDIIKVIQKPIDFLMDEYFSI